MPLGSSTSPVRIRNAPLCLRNSRLPNEVSLSEPLEADCAEGDRLPLMLGLAPACKLLYIVEGIVEPTGPEWLVMMAGLLGLGWDMIWSALMDVTRWLAALLRERSGLVPPKSGLMEMLMSLRLMILAFFLNIDVRPPFAGELDRFKGNVADEMMVGEGSAPGDNGDEF